jgi:hypothetical protein
MSGPGRLLGLTLQRAVLPGFVDHSAVVRVDEFIENSSRE